MKQRPLYITRDYKEFRSPRDAESHCLAHAHEELKSLLFESCPYLVEAHKVAQDIVLNDHAIKRLQNTIDWLRDAKGIEEE